MTRARAVNQRTRKDERCTGERPTETRTGRGKLVLENAGSLALSFVAGVDCLAALSDTPHRRAVSGRHPAAAPAYHARRYCAFRRHLSVGHMAQCAGTLWYAAAGGAKDACKGTSDTASGRVKRCAGLAGQHQWQHTAGAIYLYQRLYSRSSLGCAGLTGATRTCPAGDCCWLAHSSDPVSDRAGSCLRRGGGGGNDEHGTF